MNQSAFIAAALLAGLVLFIAARGRLKTYADVLFGPAPSLPPFLGIPLLTVGAAAAPAPSGGAAARPSPSGAANDNAAGNAATNDNWMSQAGADAATVAEDIGLAAIGL